MGYGNDMPGSFMIKPYLRFEDEYNCLCNFLFKVFYLRVLKNYNFTAVFEGTAFCLVTPTLNGGFGGFVKASICAAHDFNIFRALMSVDIKINHDLCFRFTEYTG